MSTRERLPNRRGNQAFPIIVDGIVYRVTVGLFPNGRVGELFINANKVNSGADIAVRDAAIAASIALQYGAPLDTLRKALTKNANGRSAGALGAALDMIELPS